MNYARFEALTFDCYGTLIDWETGLAEAFRPVLRAHGVEAGDDDVIARYARHEAAAEAGPYLRYRDVLAAGLQGVAGELGCSRPRRRSRPSRGRSPTGRRSPTPRRPSRASRSRFRLGVITNCDDDLFAASNRRLGVAFDWIVTAEQVGAYKPDERNFNVAFERLGLPRERILHVAQSLYHDHVHGEAARADDGLDRPARGSRGLGRDAGRRGHAGRQVPGHGVVRGGRRVTTSAGSGAARQRVTFGA